MIYSVLQQKEVPITVTKEIIKLYDDPSDVTRYTVHDAKEPLIDVGYVDLQDTKDGVKVAFIKSQHPNHYKHFGQVADQIELEHCLNRGIEKPYIHSVAALGTHVQHFLRGKRFINEKINEFLASLTKNLQKGERVHTGNLGMQKMYMPINMINELKEKIKLNPLLKGIK